MKLRLKIFPGKIIRIFLSLIVLSLLSIQVAFGAITGKISGKITDNEGSALPGANVIIEGTQRGAATDVDGNYIILSVTPGTYSVSASMMGFQKLVQTEVLVQSGRTTNLNFALETTVIAGEAVVIKAERPVIEVDRTSTEFIVSSKEIANTPIIGSVEGLMRFMPGVGLDGSNRMVIRGGDNTDVDMYYDGIPMDGYRDINIFSIEEASITTGGVGVEYGNAQGGIINVVTKDGDDKFHGTIEYGISPGQKNHWGANYWDDAYHLDDEGNSRLRWNDPDWANEVDPVTGRKVHEKIEYTDIWSQSVKMALAGPLLLKNLYFSVGSQFSQGSAGPMAVTKYSLPYTRNNWKFTYKARPNLTFQTGGFYNWSKGYNSGSNTGSGVSFTTGGLGSQEIDGAIRGMRIGDAGSYTDDRNIFLPLDFSAGGTHTNQDYLTYFSMVHMINPSTFYDLKIYRFENSQNNQNVPDSVVTTGRTDQSGWYYIDGGQGIRFTDANTTRTGAKLDISSQITNNHLLKLGVDYQKYNVWQTTYTHMSTERSLTRICDNFETGKGVTPTKFAAYLSDKMEFGGLVVNLGGRFDYFDFGATFPVTYALSNLSRAYNSFTRFNNLPDDLWVKPDPLTALSPRLGLSHPISEKATIHFYYGHLYQLPSFYDIYHDEWMAKNPKNEDTDNNENGIVDNTELYNRLNDTSNNLHSGNSTLDFEKTTTFEMGVDWNFYEDYILTMTTYYKSAESQIKGGATQQFWDPARISTAPYVRVNTNTQYEDAKGFEFLIKKRFNQLFSFQATFNLGWATEGSSGERVRTYVPNSTWVENYYFEKYTTDTNGDGSKDEFDSGAEVPVALSESAMERKMQAADDYIALLREQGATLHDVEDVEGLYYVSTHYSSVGHPRANISRRTSFNLILYLDLPSDFGPGLFGFKPLANIHANLLYSHQEGLPFQYASIDGKALWRSAPMNSTANLRLEKSVRYAGMNNTFFLTINNLFNQQDLNNSGSFDSIVSLRDYVSYGLEGYSPLQDYSFDFRGLTDGGIYLGSPRSYSFGVRVSF